MNNKDTNPETATPQESDPVCQVCHGSGSVWRSQGEGDPDYEADCLACHPDAPQAPNGEEVKGLDGSQGSPVELVSIEGPGPLNEIGTPKPPRVIDWTKPVWMPGTKYAVRIIAIDHSLRAPVIGVYEGANRVTEWAYDGVFSHDRRPSILDIENVPEVAA